MNGYATEFKGKTFSHIDGTAICGCKKLDRYDEADYFILAGRSYIIEKNKGSNLSRLTILTDRFVQVFSEVLKSDLVDRIKEIEGKF